MNTNQDTVNLMGVDSKLVNGAIEQVLKSERPEMATLMTLGTLARLMRQMDDHMEDEVAIPIVSQLRAHLHKWERSRVLELTKDVIIKASGLRPSKRGHHPTEKEVKFILERDRAESVVEALKFILMEDVLADTGAVEDVLQAAGDVSDVVHGFRASLWQLDAKTEDFVRECDPWDLLVPREQVASLSLAVLKNECDCWWREALLVMSIKRDIRRFEDLSREEFHDLANRLWEVRVPARILKGLPLMLQHRYCRIAEYATEMSDVEMPDDLTCPYPAKSGEDSARQFAEATLHGLVDIGCEEVKGISIVCGYTYVYYDELQLMRLAGHLAICESCRRGWSWRELLIEITGARKSSDLPRPGEAALLERIHGFVRNLK